MRAFTRIHVFVFVTLAVTLTALASNNELFQGLLPINGSVIHYPDQTRDDPVSLLQRTASGLKYDPSFGYVPAVLRSLQIPVSSQVLVFSKTSFQSPKISPRMPRAIYFNDDTYVGFVHGGYYSE